MILKSLQVTTQLVVLCFTLTLPLAASASAVDTVKWGTDSWKGFTEYNGSGFYHELIRTIYPEPDYILEVEYLPWKRSVKKLFDQDIDMTGAMPKNSHFIQSSMPLLNEPIILLTKANKPVVVESLQGKLGAYRAGYDQVIFYANLPAETAGVSVRDIDQALSLLEQDKIDFIVDTKSLIETTLNRDEYNELAFTEIGFYPLFWSFNKTQRGTSLKHQFDTQLTRLYEQGRLSLLYQKYGLSMPNQWQSID